MHELKYPSIFIKTKIFLNPYPTPPALDESKNNFAVFSKSFKWKWVTRSPRSAAEIEPSIRR
jgi:hypothetical protein